MRKLQHKHFLHYLISFAASQIIFFFKFCSAVYGCLDIVLCCQCLHTLLIYDFV